MAHHPMHPNRNTPPQCPPCLGELCNHACITLALIHGNKTHMAPNLLHIVTRLQHEVQDGSGFEPPVALPPHNMGTMCVMVLRIAITLSQVHVVLMQPFNARMERRCRRIHRPRVFGFISVGTSRFDYNNTCPVVVPPWTS